MSFLITMFVVFFLQTYLAWLIYSHQGRAKPDDENSPVIKNSADAATQRYLDLFCKKEKK